MSFRQRSTHLALTCHEIRKAQVAAVAESHEVARRVAVSLATSIRGRVTKHELVMSFTNAGAFVHLSLDCLHFYG